MKKYFKTESEAVCSVLQPLAEKIQLSTANLYYGDAQDYIDIFGETINFPFFAYHQDTEIPCASWQEALESAIWLATGDVPFIWTRQVGKKWEAGLSND